MPRLLTGRRARVSRRIAALISVLFLLVLLLVSYFNVRLVPVLNTLCEKKARATVSQAVSLAVEEVLGEAGELVRYSYDERGRLTLLTCDTAAANRIRTEAAQAVLTALEKPENTALSVPVGSLTDSPLLAGRGPEISVHVLPVTEASVTLSDSFTAAGINQTLFTLSADVHVGISLLSPLKRDAGELFVTLPLVQVIISGDVPQVYVGA